MRKLLTAALVKTTKPPEGGRLEIHDTIVPQLALRITSNGAKSYVVRTRINGEQVRITIGDASVGNLKDAREDASEILRMCKRGIDPREVRRRQKLESEAADKLHLDNVVAVFIERYASKNITVGETKRIFDRYVLPRWNDRLLTEITRSDVVDLLDQVEDNAGLHMANRTLAAVRKLFNWALVERAIIEASPIVPGMARKGEASRDRYLSPDEIGLVWAAAESLGYPFGPFVRLLLVTGQRRSEVAGMRWLDLDLHQDRLWVLPAQYTKAGREHFVPLSDLAINILQTVPRVGGLVFTTQGERPVSGFSKAKRRLDEIVMSLMRMIATKTGQSPEGIEPLPSWRFHDLRRTVATHMEDELGIAPHIVGAVLNHDPRQHKGVTATYLRGRLIAERMRALASWAQFLESITNRDLLTTRIGSQIQ